MNSAVGRLGRLSSTGLGLSVFLSLFVLGCGDKSMTTQPLTPTPIPTRIPSHVSVGITLSPTTPVPGAKHTGLAAIAVTETGGKSVSLTSMRASGNDERVVQVVGFVPLQLGANQTKTFTVTLVSNFDISCSVGVSVTIDSSDSGSVAGDAGCETVNWPF